MKNLYALARPLAALLLAAVAQQTSAAAAQTSRDTVAYDQRRLLAGHVTRRLGFGPTPAELDAIASTGIEAWIDAQLSPASIDDSAAEARFVPIPTDIGDSAWPRRWLTRMIYSRRQLQEKMTLVWHEHFANSVSKVGDYKAMNAQEEMFRRNCLGSFRTMLADVTVDVAMLVYLDNNYNMGRDYDGSYVVPNENYARELLQLFALGTDRLNLDGTPVLGEDGLPEPAYSERDVREVARALTGWYAYYTDPGGYVGPFFDPAIHDPRPKSVMGATLPGRDGEDGGNEVFDVVDLLMTNPTMAPFVSKSLIVKLATETPTPGYVARVATVFRDSDGDLGATVRAIATDPEFISAAVVRTGYKTPLEHYVGQMRALGVTTHGVEMLSWTSYTGHQPFAPPSVFSFYRPGQKGSLVTASQVAFFDTFADALLDGFSDELADVSFDARALMAEHRIRRPRKAVDFLADRLLAAPLDPRVRAVILRYLGRGRVSEEKFRGAAWLIITSPDYQLN